MTDESKLDVVICASPHDIRGLLPTALSCLYTNFLPLERVHLVTPDTLLVKDLTPLPAAESASISIWSDDEIFPEARDMDPWFRQQYIKLNVDRLTDTDRVVCLGADTLILDPVSTEDLVHTDGRTRLRYFRYGRPNPHLHFERQRVLNVARILSTRPRRSLVLGDFICDLFLFDVNILREFRRRIETGGGLGTLLTSFGKRQGSDNRFGEWTAYAVFCLDVLGADVQVTRSTPAYFGQIHSRSDMERAARYASRIVHFATEPGGTNAVLADLRRKGRLP